MGTEKSTRATYLVQRLKKPFDATPEGDWRAMAHQAFGGAKAELSKEALQLFRHVCSFDYMGAAEYEFGKIPTVLREIAAEKVLVKSEYVLPANIIKPGYWRQVIAESERRKELEAAKAEGKKAKPAKPVEMPATLDMKFFILCTEEEKEYAEALIRALAAGVQRLKESACLEYVLDPDPRREDFYKDLVGWLELNHGFFFFRDEQMCDRILNIFNGFSDDKEQSE